MSKLYPAQFEDCVGVESFKDSIVVTFRDVPEAITQGYTFGDAVCMAEDALKAAMEFYDEAGKPRPQPSEPQHDDVLIELR